MTETGIVHGSGVQVLQEMLKAVIDKGDVAGLKELVTLYREEQDRAAKREFFADFADFQAECPPIPKTSTANIATKSGAKYSYSYPELDEIASVVGPHAHKRGFSYGWDCRVSEARIVSTTCTLRHRNGHSETATFECPIDASSSMNEPQKVAAALTYAKRQSLVQVLGLTTTDPDSDVRPEAVELVTREQIDTLRAMLSDTKSDIVLFFKYIGRMRFEDMTQADYRRAIAALEQKTRAT